MTHILELLKILSQSDIRGCFEGWEARMERSVDYGWKYYERYNM